MHDTTLGVAHGRPRHIASLLPSASLPDTFLLAADVILPTIAKGVIVRRPGMLALAERFDLDRRAIRRMQRLRRKYGTGALLFGILGRRIAVVFDAEDVHRILSDTPEPFASAVAEKRAALAHFEPKNVLISNGAERADRLRYHEEALEPHHELHHLAGNFVRVVESEANRLSRNVGRGSALDWETFADSWFRMVRRVIFGNAAAEDHELSEMMYRLRSAANWAFLRPQRRGLRDRLLDRIRRYLRLAEPGSLAGAMADIHTTGETAPAHQVPQWLFALDPAGMTTFRALALLASHPEQGAKVRSEILRVGSPAAGPMPHLRAAVLESLRLWPTTPLLLRETTSAVGWRNGIIPADTAILIFTPFFHRDDERLTYADRFAPEIWRNEQTVRSAPLIPFSEGPGMCPGRELVLLLSTAMLSAILGNSEVRLLGSQRLDPARPLPATLNHFALRFAVE